MRLHRSHARVLIAVAVLVLSSAALNACPICYRDPESPMTAGVMAGVGTLLSVTGGVLSGFAVLVRRLIRAERSPNAARGGGS